MTQEIFNTIKIRIKERKTSLAKIAKALGKSSSFIGVVMRGNYPYHGRFGMPKYLHDYFINNGLATAEEITWNRPMTSTELTNYYNQK